MSNSISISKKVLALFVALMVGLSSFVCLGGLKAEAASVGPMETELVTVKSSDYNALKISWPHATNATKYEVWRATSKSGKYSKIKTTGEYSYTDKKGIVTGKVYYYKVRGVKGSSKGKYSGVVKGQAKFKTSPKISKFNKGWTDEIGSTISVKVDLPKGAKYADVYFYDSKKNPTTGKGNRTNSLGKLTVKYSKNIVYAKAKVYGGVSSYYVNTSLKKISK